MGWFRAGFSLDNQPSSKRPSLGRWPWEQDQEEGGRELGGSSAWLPSSAPPRLPTSRPACPGCGNGGQPGWLRGACMSQVPCRKFPQAQLSCPGSASADVVSKGEARNPKLPCFATCGPFSEQAGVPATPLPPLPPPPPAFPAQSRCSSSVGYCVGVRTGGSQPWCELLLLAPLSVAL